MALKDTWVRTAPPARKFHTTHKITSWLGAGEEELCLILLIHKSVAIQVLPHKKMRLIRNR